MASVPLLIPVPDDGHKAGRVYLGVTIPLIITSITTLLARIWLRRRSGVAFGWEDYLIILGFLLATVDWALLTVAISWIANDNTHVVVWGIFQRSVKLGVIAIPIWGFSIGCIKISVACLLLRFQQSRIWKYFLYALIFMIAAVAIGSGVFISTSCIPLAANWNPAAYPHAKCVSPSTVRSVSNFVGGFSIATDVILTLFPLTFLVTLRRPYIEKVLIASLMGVGLLASGASITKAVYVQKWSKDPGSIYFAYMISAFSTAEMLIGCTAACLPCLKLPIQRLLTSCGIDFEREYDNSGFWGSLQVTNRPRDIRVIGNGVKRNESDDEKESGDSSTEVTESRKESV